MPELADDLAMALDPALLMARAGWPPDPWQARVLRSTALRMLLNCARQAGKSRTVATLACHMAIYNPGSLTLILSPGERQSKETFRKVTEGYRALGSPVPTDAETKLELELATGSRIVALPGVEGTIRGYSGVDLMIVDEASRVDDLIMDAARPMLATSNGRLLALSTPWGKRGWWYEAWEHQGSAWERVEVTAAQCPRISPEFLASERLLMVDLQYRSEYLCQFVDTVDQYFATADIDAMMVDLPPLFPISKEALAI